VCFPVSFISNQTFKSNSLLIESFALFCLLPVVSIIFMKDIKYGHFAVCFIIVYNILASDLWRFQFNSVTFLFQYDKKRISESKFLR